MSTMTNTELQQLAGEAYDCFETVTKDNGEEFVRVKDGSPEWVTQLVYKAHGEFLPDEWRYRTIQNALAFIHDNEDAEDMSSEFADSEVDVYNAARFAWLASHIQRQFYVDEAISELGWDQESGIAGAIGLGQYEEAGEVFALVLEALEAQAA